MKQTLLLTIAFIFATQVWAYDFIDNGIYYNRLDEDDIEVTFYTGYTGAISIPITASDGTTTYNVTSIGNFAFSISPDLTSVVIPNSITNIGDNAFEFCPNLTFIEIPNSITSIGDFAFRSCRALTSIEIPNSVTSIGFSAFEYCTSLTSIEIPNGITSIEMFTFDHCTNLTSIVIPNSVESIDSYAFRYCSNLTSIEIPNSVTLIDDCAFSDCVGLATVSVLNLNPEKIVLGRMYGNNIFYGVMISGVKLMIPSSAVNSYKETSIWERFNVQGGGLLVATASANNAQGSVSGDGLYQGNTRAIVTATPRAGYRFVNWTENGIEVSTEAAYNFTVTKDIKLIANFESGGSSLDNMVADVIKIYPNPTTGRVFVKIQTGNAPQVRVFNLQGALLQDVRNDEIDLTGYPKGAYLIEVDGKLNKIIKK